MGLIVAIIGAALTAYLQVRAMKQQEALNEAAAEQKRLEALAAQDAAAFEETQARRRNALVQGKSRAIFAAAGLDPTQGSALFADIDLLKQSELEALNIRAVGAGQAASSRFEANIAKYRARQAKAQIPLIIASGVVSAASGSISAYNSQRQSTLSDWHR